MKTCMMAGLFNTITMRSGNNIPLIGLGVYKSEAGGECYNAVLHALKVGYRHIDTAQFYQNEEDVGQAVIDSGIPRNEVFITTKLWLSEFGYQKATNAINLSLSKLKTHYVDLVLLHAPGDPLLRIETWKALEDLKKASKLRDIGVSNFGIPHLEKLAMTTTIPPAVNQIEIHPWLQRVELVKYCQEHDIVVQAYSPFAKGQKLSDPVVSQIADRLGKTSAQVLLAWSLQKGKLT